MNPIHPLRALSHRNFRLFFFGQGISLIGTWMQQLAMSWLVFKLTDSSFKLGIVLFLSNIPSLVLSPFIGVLVDRWNRQRLIVVIQTMSMLQAFALAALSLSATIAVWHIYLLGFMLGVLNAFDNTARQTFIVEMTSRRDLSNAIALNSTLFNGARLIGPSLAGLLLAATSPGVCFLVNGISYVPVIGALLAMRLRSFKGVRKSDNSLNADFRDGVCYIFKFMPVRNILLLTALCSAAASSYSVLLPEITIKTIHGTALTLGWLGAATGCGALSAALFLVMRKKMQGLEIWVALGPIMLGLGLLAFSLASTVVSGMAALVLVGFGMVVQFASSNTILQTIVDDDKRGRVISFFTAALLGMTPVGSLLTGSLSSAFSASVALQLNGSICLLGGMLFAVGLPRMRMMIHPVYVRMGMPE